MFNFPRRPLHCKVLLGVRLGEALLVRAQVRTSYIHSLEEEVRVCPFLGIVFGCSFMGLHPARRKKPVTSSGRDSRAGTRPVRWIPAQEYYKCRPEPLYLVTGSPGVSIAAAFFEQVASTTQPPHATEELIYNLEVQVLRLFERLSFGIDSHDTDSVQAV